MTFLLGGDFSNHCTTSPLIRQVIEIIHWISSYQNLFHRLRSLLSKAVPNYWTDVVSHKSSSLHHYTTAPCRCARTSTWSPVACTNRSNPLQEKDWVELLTSSLTCRYMMGNGPWVNNTGAQTAEEHVYKYSTAWVLIIFLKKKEEKLSVQ